MSTELLEDTGQDVNLSELSSLVSQMTKLEDEIATDELSLKNKKASLEKLQMTLIPEKMGPIKELKIDVDGVQKTVKIKPILRVNVKKENKPAAFQWLEEHGHGTLIKTELSMAFDRKDKEKADETLKVLQDLGYHFEMMQDVHWATFDAWAREQDEQGIEFPEVIGIYRAKKAEVKNGK